MSAGPTRSASTRMTWNDVLDNAPLATDLGIEIVE
jgi:hypothetical protein